MVKGRTAACVRRLGLSWLWPVPVQVQATLGAAPLPIDVFVDSVFVRADSPFFQQRLKAWQPILTPRWVIISFLIVAVVFLPIGFILRAASDSVRGTAKASAI